MSDSLKRISELGALMQEQQQAVAAAEAELRARKAALLRTQREDLPELMRECGVSELRLASGARVTLREDVEARITEARRAAAHEWLIERGFGGLICTAVEVDFPRGARGAAVELAERLTAEGVVPKGGELFVTESVHPATLKAFIREQMAAGMTVPFDLFSIVPFTYAQIKE